MKVADLLGKEMDIDVYDDVTETLGIAFCGPVNLTAAGKEHFKDALELEIEITEETGIVHVDGPEGVWQKNLEAAAEFFHSAAGYCASSNYKLWFDLSD